LMERIQAAKTLATHLLGGLRFGGATVDAA